MQGNVPGMNHGPPSASGAYVPPPRKSRLAVGLAALAVALAAAALVVSLVRKPEVRSTPSTPSTQTTASTTAAAAPAQEIYVEDADRALCEAISPLMKEND